jgi:hypothetical protein
MGIVSWRHVAQDRDDGGEQWGGVYPSWIVDPQKKKRKKNSSFLQTFLDNLSVPSSRLKPTKKFFLDCLNL